ncbi:hypothetical protein ACFLZ7_00870 [Nanoarchaeota archaeon]
MYKLPKRAKKRVVKMKNNDKELWSLKKIKKDDSKFTKAAKIIRNTLFKKRLDIQTVKTIKKKWNKVAKKELRQLKKSK